MKRFKNASNLEDMYPEVSLSNVPYLDDYFKSNQHVAGMAIGGGENGIQGNRVVVYNPYNQYMDDTNKRDALLNLERARHYMSENNFNIPINNRQRKYYNKGQFDGTYKDQDDQTIVRTDASRYLVGDKNKMNMKQKKYTREFFKAKKMQGGGYNDDFWTRAYNTVKEQANNGNPTAQRILFEDKSGLAFGNKKNPEAGSVLIGSANQYAFPLIQYVNGKLKYIKNPFSKRNIQRTIDQSIVFDNDDDAMKFGNEYHDHPELFPGIKSTFVEEVETWYGPKKSVKKLKQQR